MKTGRSLRSLLPIFVSALPAAMTAGCAMDGGIDEDPASVAQPIVSTTAPAVGPKYATTPPPLPGLVSGAYPVDGLATDTSNTAIHGGVHFNGKDLNAAVVTADQTWLDQCRGDQYSSTEPFPARLAEALAFGEGMESRMDASVIDEAFTLLKQKGGKLTEDLIQTHKYGFKADRARWKRSDVVKVGTAIPIYKQVAYSDPRHFEEIRMRGARQYCAAAETARQQNGQLVSMGEQSAASFHVFGKKIEVLVLEPTAVVSPPQRYVGDGANDGAQAFAVPLLLGNKITPIRGLGLPGLGEVRSPLTLVSGDSEVVSRQASTLPGLTPSYQTVTNAAGFVTTSKGIEASLPNIKLYKLGPFEVYLAIKLGLNIGSHQVPNDGLLSGAPVGWPLARGGNPLNPAFYQEYGGHTYYDGAWVASTFAPPATSMSLNPSSPVYRSIPAYDPFVARALQDDDHVIRKLTTASISASVGTSFGVEWTRDKFGVGANLAVEGGLKGTAGAVHTVRDAAYGEKVPAQDLTHVGATQMLPETGITVTPSTMAQLDFVSRAIFNLYIKLPVIGKVGWSKVLYDLSVPLAHWESEPWAEKHRLRIGTGADAGDVMKKPSVASHLPQRDHFQSFPSGVDACLASDPGEIPPEPDPCSPTVDDGEAPAANICVYAKSVSNHPFWTPVCGSIDPYVASLGGALTAEQKLCVDRQLTFSCAGVSLEQWSSEGWVVSRIVDLENQILMEELGNVMDFCGQAFGGNASAVTDLFGFAACDDYADLWGDDIIQVEDSSWRTPEDPTGGTCQ